MKTSKMPVIKTVGNMYAYRLNKSIGLAQQVDPKTLKLSRYGRFTPLTSLRGALVAYKYPPAEIAKLETFRTVYFASIEWNVSRGPDDSLRIGCHVFSRKTVERLAKFLKISV